MRTPTRIPSRPPNPYDELASLADPEPGDPAPETAAPAPESAEPAPGPAALTDTQPLTVLPLQLLHGDTDEEESWSPPNHRRGKRGRGHRRRRGPLAAAPRTAKLLIVLSLCAGILVLADRCAQMYAEKKAQQKLQQELHLAAAPQVDIHGFPFLTQVLEKRLERVDVTVPHVAAERVSLAKVHASSRDIRLTGNLPSDIRGAVIGDLDGEVLLSFADMNRELAASQVAFRRRSDRTIGADGKLTVGGQELRVRAQAQLQLNGSRGLSTEVDDMSLDVPGIATYRPGKGRGLTLHRETAERISRDAARAKALFSVPALAERLGVSQQDAEAALRSEEKLHRLTGAPRFVERLTHLNLIDAAMDNPWLLKKLGIDPKLIGGLIRMRPPELSDRLTFSFSLPKEARELQLRDVRVEKDGIRATLRGMELPVGRH
ncbi:LmeA family phospholipid-binding protein [Streptomyces sp. URMC 124]|uniref:LmeA family phospholipid-binding protein n=1 Tax=Streptomyces sp. URMC 124 TaxID=3423405 RepID=UPI003F1D4B9D